MSITKEPTRYQTHKLIPGTPWFLLYGGSSEDGRGPGKYMGKTFYPSQALTFYRQHIKSHGGYATGYVQACYDDCTIHVDETWLKNEIRQQDQMADKIAKHQGQPKVVESKDRPEGYGTFA